MEKMKGLEFIQDKNNIGKCLYCFRLWNEGEKEKSEELLKGIGEYRYIKFLKS